MNITFIGGGNMAAAMIGGLLKQGWTPASIRVVEIAAAARERLARELRIEADVEISATSAAADCIVLAVKPQSLRAAARALRPFLGAQLVISIAAGIRMGDLSRWLAGYRRIVRVMPNTPALARAGISGLCAMPAVSADERARAQNVLSAVGTTLWLENEDQLDAVTAVSGSGPAYVFYFMEALQQAAGELGFKPEEARRLALETFAGAVRLVAESGEEAAVLRARVTSKGGTTERALAVMDAQALRQIVSDAVRAAADRSRELGDELGRSD
ncbi:MAG: pyrroline-5-carboxylate reductase [Betaproteobacteria bacterium]|nr:pyrroline-5-carboxylate reductase [Betaproteobacteria bacterium]